MDGSEGVNGEVSGEEAAWRDLVARFDLPADPASTEAPWPDRENLTEPGTGRHAQRHGRREGRGTWEDPDGRGSRGGPASLPRSGPASLHGPASMPGSRPRTHGGGTKDGADDGTWGTDSPASGWDSPDWAGSGRDGSGSAADPARDAASADTGGRAEASRAGQPAADSETADLDGAALAEPGLAPTGLAGTGLDEADPAGLDPGTEGLLGDGKAPGHEAGSRGRGSRRAVSGRGFAAERARIIRRAIPRPAAPTDDDEDEDDRYRPPPPEPLPQLDPVAKAAWVGLLGGPLYLLVSTLADWQLNDVLALAAIAAFIGGFVTLVWRMGDRPPDDDDDGAVV